MSRDDRLIAKARRHLDGEELLLASAVGREVDGRRGRVVLVTDRRVVVAWTRPAPVDDLTLLTCTASYEPRTATLTVADDGRSISIRDVDAHAARPVVETISTVAALPLVERLGRALRVRIVDS